jgi:hypothetical protein
MDLASAPRRIRATSFAPREEIGALYLSRTDARFFTALV